MRTYLLVGLVVASTLLGGRAWAGQAYLQNDTFTGSSHVNIGADFSDYGAAGVFLNAGPGMSYPLTLKGIEVLYAPQSGAGSSEPWDLEIFSTPDGGLPTVASGDLYSDYVEGTNVGFTTSTNSFNTFTLPTPISIDGPIFVQLKEPYDCNLDGICYSGVIALDDATPVLGANWFLNHNRGYEDMSYPDSGYPYGNWIIRGVVDAPDVDAGPSTTSTTTSSTTTAGSTSGTTTASTSTAGSSTSTTTAGSSTGSSTTTTGTTTGGSTTSTGTTGTSGALTLTSIQPTQGYSADDTQVTLVGSNFAIGIQALIGPATLTALELRSPAVLVATLPHGTAPGTYDVTVVNPDGAQATLHGAFTVVAGGSSGSSGATGSGGSGSAGASGSTGGTTGAKSGGCGCASTTDAALFALPFALIALRRRRSVR
ncbi:MAG: IPT/TIG domain-containing protein [Deltaproteobacteria bacterium]|nr:IPT/TIG domain-containing protein [Deltaproteobacteria bacterium]